MAEFLLYCHNKIKEGSPYLSNMDENPIWYEMKYTKTVESFGKKMFMLNLSHLIN